ncbi:YidC/Oxa1 family membrane protein insertase, partial [Patescibacteria group bacterium]|nr:YidC/Oxa1 family membrane protein insertase [Patescibacteria group bacterium]
FNLLIWIYSNWTNENLGWAVVYLTIILRVVLLPFTLVTEKGRAKSHDIGEEITQINKDFSNDPQLKKEETRKFLRKKKVSPWSKTVVLGIQGLVLVLLYQVFLRGITGEKILKILYSWIDFPGKINTTFYGFELGSTHDIIWPGIVGIFLLIEIYLGYRKQKLGLTKADLAYFILFPLFCFAALWILPMVKSLFILTSLVFSVIIHQFSRVIFKPSKVAVDGEVSDKS